MAGAAGFLSSLFFYFSWSRSPQPFLHLLLIMWPDGWAHEPSLRHLLPLHLVLKHEFCLIRLYWCLLFHSAYAQVTSAAQWCHCCCRCFSVKISELFTKPTHWYFMSQETNGSTGRRLVCLGGGCHCVLVLYGRNAFVWILKRSSFWTRVVCLGDWTWAGLIGFIFRRVSVKVTLEVICVKRCLNHPPLNPLEAILHAPTKWDRRNVASDVETNKTDHLTKEKMLQGLRWLRFENYIFVRSFGL